MLSDPLILIFAGILAVLIWIFSYALPNREIASSTLSEEERAKLRNEHRKTFGQFMAGVAVLLGLYVSWQEFRASQEERRSTKRARDRAEFTSRFSTAVEHLSSEKLSLRLGGVFALERLARDSAVDHWSVMEVLSAFVRENSKWNGANGQNKEPGTGDQEVDFANYKGRPPADVQAALTALGRRWLGDSSQERELREANRRLNLIAVDLRGADLSGLNFQRALFREAHLEYADLSQCQLEKADLSGAHLAGGDLRFARLQGAYFRDADLEGAFLNGAQLGDADFMFANLRRARLVGAHFGKTNLDRANLRGAYLGHARGITRSHFESQGIRGAPFIDQSTEPPTNPLPDWWADVLKNSLALQEFLKEQQKAVPKQTE